MLSIIFNLDRLVHNYQSTIPSIIFTTLEIPLGIMLCFGRKISRYLHQLYFTNGFSTIILTSTMFGRRYGNVNSRKKN